MEQYSDSNPNRYLNATFLFHWLHDTSGGNGVAASSIPESTQLQGQHRIWYGYPGQPSSFYQGSSSKATRIAQVLDSGQEQSYVQTVDASGRLLTATDPLGRKTSYHYAANGIDLAALRNDLTNGGAGEQEVGITYNSIHRPLTITDYAGQTYTATYNTNGQMTSMRRPDGTTFNLTYDARGFLTQVSRAGTSFVESFTYDAANRIRTWTATDGYTLTYDYDNLDRMTRITYPDGTSYSVVFDRRDVVEVHDRLGRITRFAYDSADRLFSATDPGNRTTTYSWCGCGTLEQVTDPLGHSTRWLHDGLNRVVGRLLNERVVELFAYDGSGHLIRRTDAMGQVTRYSYGLDDRRVGVTYESASRPTASVTFQWDFLYPRLALMSDGTGTTTYSYYPAGVAGVAGAGNVASVTTSAPGHTVAYQYDVLGRRTSYSVDSTLFTNTFDALDRVASSGGPLGTFTAAFDGASDRPTSIVYPNGMGPVFTYLDAAHDFRLSQLRWGPAGPPYNLSQLDYSYDAASQRISGLVRHDALNPTGAFLSFVFDPAGQLQHALQTTNPVPRGSVVHDYGYGYDLAGNRTTESIDGTISLSTFDDEDQQIAVERGLSEEALRAIRASRRRATTPKASHPPVSQPQGGHQ